MLALLTSFFKKSASSVSAKAYAFLGMMMEGKMYAELEETSTITEPGFITLENYWLM